MFCHHQLQRQLRREQCLVNSCRDTCMAAEVLLPQFTSPTLDGRLLAKRIVKMSTMPPDTSLKPTGAGGVGSAAHSVVTRRWPGPWSLAFVRVL